MRSPEKLARQNVDAPIDEALTAMLPWKGAGSPHNTLIVATDLAKKGSESSHDLGVLQRTDSVIRT